MRPFVILILGTLALSSVAHAQSATPSASNGYVEAVGQSVWGNLTSQSYGGEFGISLMPGLQLFVDAGQVNNAAPNDLNVSAAKIAGALQTSNQVTFTAKEPIAFGLAGLRFVISSGSLQPYFLGGAGVARVKKDVTFTVGGSDVTNNMGQFGAVLGSDLSGTENKPMLTIGGGVAWLAWQRLVIDFQYRYGRVFTADQGTNVNRAGTGIGVRF